MKILEWIRQQWNKLHKASVDNRSWEYPYTQPTHEDLQRLLQVYEFKPGVKYLIWIATPINPTIIKGMVKGLGDLLKGQAALVCGIEHPTVFELKVEKHDNVGASQQEDIHS